MSHANSTLWTEPGVELVAAGVHRIALPLPNDSLRAVNVYAINDGDKLTLIDGGWALAEAQVALEAAVAQIGHDLSSISRFLVTHVHRDHLTLALTVRRLFGSEVHLGAGEEPSLAELLAGRHDGPFRLLSRWGGADLAERLRSDHGRGPEREPYSPPDRWITGPTTIPLAGRTLRALPTPGHTRGHLVFADITAGLLFAGDHVLPHITPSIGYEPVRADHPLRDYLTSLTSILDLPDMRLLPAHGSVGPSTHRRIQELLNHHKQRLDSTAEAISDDDALSAYQVAARLGWTRRSRSFDDLDLLNQALAVSETAAHLDVLVDRGRLTVDCVEEIEYYRLPRAGPPDA
jgi:glyoxylase-like metal-dependent hydrolase (beta-lactamase superfamily II)